jgi:hypothetical protein
VLITDELAALGRDRVNGFILGMFARGMTDREIVEALPGITYADLVSALMSLGPASSGGLSCGGGNGSTT